MNAWHWHPLPVAPSKRSFSFFFIISSSLSLRSPARHYSCNSIKSHDLHDEILRPLCICSVCYTRSSTITAPTVSTRPHKGVCDDGENTSSRTSLYILQTAANHCWPILQAGNGCEWCRQSTARSQPHCFFTSSLFLLHHSDLETYALSTRTSYLDTYGRSGVNRPRVCRATCRDRRSRENAAGSIQNKSLRIIDTRA